LSLCVLVLLAIPLTWRRIVLVGAVVAGFILLFPLHALRSFYALDLPHSGLPVTLLLAALGTASIVAFWAILQRRNHTHPNAAGEQEPGTPAADDERHALTHRRR